jgi:hypothetical protein
MRKRADVSWNHCFVKNDEIHLQAYRNARNVDSKSEKDHADFSTRNVKPQTSAEFLKIWNHLSDSKSKFEYLLRSR